MPVDLSPAGRPSAYPPRMRFWPWAATWFVCNVFGPVIVLLVWPKGESANGLKFWSWVVGAPNGLFLVLLGFARAGYEALWYRAYWRNHHRDRWLAEKIRFAQRPLHVLEAGYCLPLARRSLAEVLAGKQSLLKMQSARHGSGKVLCNRFEDHDPLLAGLPIAGEEESEGGAGVLTKPAPAVHMIRAALEPLAGSIQALTRYEKAYWPQVRVLAGPEIAGLRVAQVRDALRLAALPPLEVQIVPASDGLLVADAWLDARECRPLLAVAAAWYDDAIDEGCAEGCAAVLFGPGYFRLPPEVSPKAALHRPVQGIDGEAEYGFANAAIWGKVKAAAVTRAWITRPVEHGDRALAAAGFQAASKDAAQCRLDRIVGDAGAANGLLAIVAAIESGAAGGPQLIVDGLQSAILHVLPADQENASTHDDTQK
ncbi:hypothetical protein HDG34_002664 [Paraburkholderia sp. HC6.4b]|uniref:hypothetical protein n=2 Tax=Paraburkholderia TaxID=1822464 RepID=UPI00161A6577|nr:MULTISPECIES: hypothetical protein [unclassified Paraburkholderia]MBB5408727.1 hypothetical protein [Paraburkholderia sp. HC6.4b]MBB5450557.1 hypothetical protein [Paraburkholderia sp. Kb1A]